MPLAFDARQHFFDVVQAANEAGTKTETSGLEGPRHRRFFDRGEAGAKRFVDDGLQRLPPFTGHLLQPGGDVLLERQGRSHHVMICL